MSRLVDRPGRHPVSAATLRAHVSRRGEADQHAAAHWGAVDTALAQTAALLREAAAAIDASPAADARLPAMRTRAAAETTATMVLDRVGRATGAGPLCLDAGHARRVADLTVFLRQSHGERDLAGLGLLAAAHGNGL